MQPDERGIYRCIFISVTCIVCVKCTNREFYTRIKEIFFMQQNINCLYMMLHCTCVCVILLQSTYSPNNLHIVELFYTISCSIYVCEIKTLSVNVKMYFCENKNLNNLNKFTWQIILLYSLAQYNYRNIIFHYCIIIIFAKYNIPLAYIRVMSEKSRTRQVVSNFALLYESAMGVI